MVSLVAAAEDVVSLSTEIISLVVVVVGFDRAFVIVSERTLSAAVARDLVSLSLESGAVVVSLTVTSNVRVSVEAARGVLVVEELVIVLAMATNDREELVEVVLTVAGRRVLVVMVVVVVV
jgi:hypothetical protein